MDPLSIPKFASSLVIPPVMKSASPTTPNDYDIAVRQFKQQILPAGFPATTVWSYGPASDSADIVAPDPTSQFNYPAYTIEAKVNTPLTVDWINDLKDSDGNFREHILSIDQTLHWANPLADCSKGPRRTDCRGTDSLEYKGPVPIVTHVHGAHVGPESDGYPEAWWLPSPEKSNFLCAENLSQAGETYDNKGDNTDPNTGKIYYICQGYLANKYGGDPNTNVRPGVASYHYPNDQPSTTLWYHDHSLGMTRNNVYAGPAGFWLIRETDGGETGLDEQSILPGPAPAADETLLDTLEQRAKYREIPIVIQDRSFYDNGDLFYPANRAFFQGLGDGVTPGDPGNMDAGLDIPTIPLSSNKGNAFSDISPIWNPEAFFNVMVVNGVAWPKLEVAPAIYRFRLLNGSNSRFLNLALKLGNSGKDVPIYQIGTEQSLMPQVVRIETGFATPLPGNGVDVCAGKSGPKGRNPNCILPEPAAAPQQALLMGLAERADVLVDFRSLADGDVVTMINTAPDAPFGGFPDIPADPATTGQVMQFVVNKKLGGSSPTDPTIGNGNKKNPNLATSPSMLVLGEVDGVNSYPGELSTGTTRTLALLEEESGTICVDEDTLKYIELTGTGSFEDECEAAGGVSFAPKAAVLGTYDGGTYSPTLWSSPIVTTPLLNATETWELWNNTEDAHPIHLHLVKFKVLGRRADPSGESIIPGNGVQPWENGWKDTVIAYPGEVTTVAATFDIEGLYVWHCHIVEHEDNEMMVPYCVSNDPAGEAGCAAADSSIYARAGVLEPEP